MLLLADFTVVPVTLQLQPFEQNALPRQQPLNAGTGLSQLGVAHTRLLQVGALSILCCCLVLLVVVLLLVQQR
jgi:hypothetical protein